MTQNEYGRWNELTVVENEAVESFAAEYIEYISTVKTERESAVYCIERLRDAGFKDISECSTLISGDKVYKNIKNKGVAAAVVRDSVNGFNITAAHADSPRLALKPKPFSDDTGLGYASTYARGGIKPYLWVDLPMAMHGIVATTSGEVLNLVIGENDDEGCFMIPDASLHLSGSRMDKSLREAVPLEELNIIVGSRFAEGDLKDGVTLMVLNYLKTQYQIGPDEITAAELHIVPRGRAFSLGFDRSLIGAFGHDDRICVFSALKAIIEPEKSTLCQKNHACYTNVFFAIDREEIGSIGSTAAKSIVYENFLREIYIKQYGLENIYSIAAAFEQSRVLSADVTILTGTLEKEISDKTNAAYCGRGICLDKFMSSSNHEFVQWLLNRFNRNNIFWQQTMLGKGRVQFGGSVAASFAHKGMEVINAGPGIFCSHAPYEIVSKLDLFMTWKGYSAFYQTD